MEMEKINLSTEVITDAGLTETVDGASIATGVSAETNHIIPDADTIETADMEKNAFVDTAKEDQNVIPTEIVDGDNSVFEAGVVHHGEEIYLNFTIKLKALI